jgi:hypothetical protein
MAAMIRLLLIPVLVLFLFSSCRKDEPPPPSEITPEQARDTLYYLMDTWYYWYKEMPSVNKDDYADPYRLMDVMKYKSLDRWSFVADYDEFNAQMQGTFVGHGIRVGIDESGKARISMIYSRSDLYKAGVRRGWIVKTVNNTDVAPIIISGDGAAYSRVIGPSELGITNVFVFGKPDGKELTITSTKSMFTINSVLHYDTLHLSSGITGHLVFESFIEPSISELMTAFSFFKTNGVKDLILDLRYNSGGYLYVAQELASYIAGNGPASAQALFAKLSYNDKRQAANSTYSFRNTSLGLNLTRLAVITSRETASASEAVINGLAPFVDVITIGDTTTGKPTGMNGWDAGKKYWFWPVTFKIVNNNNEGDYFDGILPAKKVMDDITRDFKDRNELCLREAISFLTTGAFSVKGFSEFRRYPQFSEKPAWMNNAFIIRED